MSDITRILDRVQQGEPRAAAQLRQRRCQSVRAARRSGFYEPSLRKPIYPIAVHAVAFSLDGRTVAGGDGTGRLRLWETTTGKLVRELQALQAHSNWVSGVAFSPDGKRLATSSGFKLRLFDAADGGELWSADFRRIIRGQTGGDTAEDFSTVVFSPDSRSIAVGSTNGSIYLVSAASGELVRQRSPP